MGGCYIFIIRIVRLFGVGNSWWVCFVFGGKVIEGEVFRICLRGGFVFLFFIFVL